MKISPILTSEFSTREWKLVEQSDDMEKHLHEMQIMMNEIVSAETS